MNEKYTKLLQESLREDHEGDEEIIIVPTEPEDDPSDDAEATAGLYVNPEEDLQSQDDENVVAMMPEGARTDVAKRLAYKTMNKIKKAMDAGKKGRPTLYNRKGEMVP